MYTYTHLHTKSSYMPVAPNLNEGDHSKDEVFESSVQAAINSLKAKEALFASKFGYDSLDALMNAIRGLFTGSYSTDMEILQRFKSDNLRRILHREFDNNSVMLEGRKVRLVLETSKTDQELETIKSALEKAFNTTFGSRDFKITSKAENLNQLEIGLIWDVPNIKRVVNSVQGKHYVYKKTNDKGELDPRAFADYRLVEHFKSNPAALVKVISKKGKVSPYEFRTSPLAYKAKEFNKLPQEEADKLSKTVNNFVLNTLVAGASREMRAAIALVWNQNMQGAGTKFFLGGENWIDHMVGAMGEFITPAFFYYCNHRLGSPIAANNFMKLVGQDLNRFKEEKSIDIEIAFLKAAGIQVKNFNGAFWKDENYQDTSKERTVSVNLHPSDIGSLAHDPRVVPYIVNSYFNTSIGQIPNNVLEQFFKNHAYDFLNLAIDDSLIEDRATFYFIGGYFIPGSAILESAFQTTKVEERITVSQTNMYLKGGTKQGDDSSYREEGFQTKHHGIGPNFLEWWHGNTTIGWNPTDKNDLTSYEKNIVIHTTFTYSALFQAKYKLF